MLHIGMKLFTADSNNEVRHQRSTNYTLADERIFRQWNRVI